MQLPVVFAHTIPQPTLFNNQPYLRHGIKCTHLQPPTENLLFPVEDI